MNINYITVIISLEDIEKIKTEKNDNNNSRQNISFINALRPRSHVSGYFLIRNFFIPDTAIVHTHTANSLPVA